MSRHICTDENNLKKICSVCLSFIFGQGREATEEFKQAYLAYFHCGFAPESFAPRLICFTCDLTLMRWYKDKSRFPKLCTAASWKNAVVSVNDCFKCTLLRRMTMSSLSKSFLVFIFKLNLYIIIRYSTSINLQIVV